MRSRRRGLADLPHQQEVEYWQDYGRINEAALAGAYSITGSPRVLKAYEVARARTGQIGYPPSRGDPTFAILPRRARRAGNAMTGKPHPRH